MEGNMEILARIPPVGYLVEDEGAKEVIEKMTDDLQGLVNELRRNPETAEYVESGKLKALDARLKVVDDLLDYGVLY